MKSPPSILSRLTLNMTLKITFTLILETRPYPEQPPKRGWFRRLRHRARRYVFSQSSLTTGDFVDAPSYESGHSLPWTQPPPYLPQTYSMNDSTYEAYTSHFDHEKQQESRGNCRFRVSRSKQANMEKNSFGSSSRTFVLYYVVHSPERNSLAWSFPLSRSANNR